MTVLFVIATIALFLAVDWLVHKRKHPAEAAVPVKLPHTVKDPPVRIPEGIFFARSHTWLNLFPSGKVRLGIDDFVSRLFEKPEIVMLKVPGDRVARGEPILQLNEHGHSLTVRSPIEGTILGVNERLPHDADLLQKFLFSDGWAYTMKPVRPSELRELLLGEETTEWMRKEFARLRDVFAGYNADGNLVPVTLQDGGPPFAGSMKYLSDIIWKQFEDEFLKVQ